MTATSSSTEMRPTKDPTRIRKKADNTREGSVFDRLHKASTVSSRTRKVAGPVVTKNILTRDENEEKLVPTRTRQDRNARPVHRPAAGSSSKGRPVFDRLYKQGTVSSSTKKFVASKETPAAAQTQRAALKPKNHS
jgi:hypothetical protein